VEGSRAIAQHAWESFVEKIFCRIENVPKFKHLLYLYIYIYIVDLRGGGRIFSKNWSD